MVFEYCQKHAPNIRVTDCFTFQSGTHLHGCQCIKRFDYPTPTGTWNSVHASEVDKHWGKVNVALILDKTNFPNLKGADRSDCLVAMYCVVFRTFVLAHLYFI